MQKRILHLLFLAGGFWMMIACRQTPEFVVKGVVTGADGQTVYLENIGLSAVELLDSVKLNATGQFTFKRTRSDYPDFYRLRLNNQLINFAIDSTETITIVADAGTFATSYTIEGSDNGVAIKEITLAQLTANQEIKRVRNAFEAKNIDDSVYRQRSFEAINNYKAVALNYIYNQPMSTAAYFALFQKIDGLLFFDIYDRNDTRAYGAVATSMSYLYPDNPRAIHLKNLALQSLKVLRNERMVDLDAITTQEIDMLEIELPNIRNEKIKLSDVANGKVVILNFTAYQTDFSINLNRLLENVYTRNHSKGLEIYQISLDTDTHLWKNVAANLPWICVCDPQSVYSQFAAIYNVKQLPAVFILDKKGLIVKRIEDLNTIESDVLSLL